MNKALAGEMKKLVKEAEKQGRTLPVSEAFKMHPAGDEAHKGKLEYYLQSYERPEDTGWESYDEPKGREVW